MTISADCVVADQCATAFEVGDDKTMPSTVFPQRGGSIVGKRAETRSAKQCDKVCAPVALAAQGFVPACRAALHTPTLEVTQGQILSQSPTDATRFWWHLYGS